MKSSAQLFPIIHIHVQFLDLHTAEYLIFYFPKYIIFWILDVITTTNDPLEKNKNNIFNWVEEMGHLIVQARSISKT